MGVESPMKASVATHTAVKQTPTSPVSTTTHQELGGDPAYVNRSTNTFHIQTLTAAMNRHAVANHGRQLRTSGYAHPGTIQSPLLFLLYQISPFLSATRPRSSSSSSGRALPSDS